MTPGQINYPAWQFWFNVAYTLGLAGLGFYTWWRDREKVNAKRFKILEDDVKERVTKKALEAVEKERQGRCDKHNVDTRANQLALQTLSGEIKHLPSQSDIGRVHARMDSVSKEMDQAVGELKATRRQLDLVLEELLRRDKK